MAIKRTNALFVRSGARHIMGKSGNRVGNEISVIVTKSPTGRPSKVIRRRGPDAQYRAFCWGKFKPSDQSVWRREMYDLNKEIANYLSRGTRIVERREAKAISSKPARRLNKKHR